MKHMVRNPVWPVLSGDTISSSPALPAGSTYNGVTALSLLRKLPRDGPKSKAEKMMSVEFVDNLTRWLVSRQTLLLHEDEGLTIDEEDSSNSNPSFTPQTFHVIGSSPAKAHADVASVPLSVEVSAEEILYVGVNGRCNKVADTCYTFWVGGSLGVSLRSAY